MIQNQQPCPFEKDFQRDVWCLCGLPVDNCTMDSVKSLIREKTEENGPVILSTINVNWVVQSFNDPTFRSAIINSDIVTIDGKPLLWLAKSLGYPMKEVVAGSSLIQEINEDFSCDKALTIFLLGGEEGVAEKAMKKINQNQGGLRAVGALNPGFVEVEEMSSDAIINSINRTSPDILLVALGAKKGTQWIELNRHKLNAKIVSHLGATINFLAGSVRRAPKIFRSSGLEWLWRISQEPKLFTRYAADGLVMCRYIVSSFYLWRTFRHWRKKQYTEQAEIKIVQHEHLESITVILGRCVQSGGDPSVQRVLRDCVQTGKDIVLDFQYTEIIDGAFLGTIILLSKHLQSLGYELHCVNVHGKLINLLSLAGLSSE